MSIIHLTDDQLQFYLESGIGKDNSSVETHLQTCEQCRQQLEAYTFVFSELNSESDEVFSPGFESDIIKKIQKSISVKSKIKTCLLYSAAIIFGSIISVYIFFSVQIPENLLNFFVDKWIGAKYLYDYIFRVSSDLNISSSILISAGIILFIYELFDRLIQSSTRKKLSIFNNVKIFV